MSLFLIEINFLIVITKLYYPLKGKYPSMTLTILLIEFISAISQFKKLEMRTYFIIISRFTEHSLIYQQSVICPI